MANMTAEEARSYADQLREAGYQGPIKKTTIAGSDFIVRAVTRNEIEQIRAHLGETTTQEEFERLLVDVCVVPALDWDTVGYMVLPALVEKVWWLSGRPLQNPIAAFLADETLATASGWDAPTEEDKEKAKKLVEKMPFTGVKVASILDAYHFIYRTVSGKEYREAVLNSDGDQMKTRAAVLAQGVMWPTDVAWDEIPGFVEEVLEEKIYLISGWGVETTIEEDEDL